MDIKQIQTKKKEMEQIIKRMFREFSQETGLKIKKTEISSFYDVEEIIGKHNVNIEIENPF